MEDTVVDGRTAQHRPLSLTHVVYAHEEGVVGQALAMASLLPVFIAVAMVTLAASRRDLATFAMGVGQAGNEVLNWALRRLFRAPRPPATALHLAPPYGMPSNHAQFMGFWAAYLGLWVALRWQHARHPVAKATIILGLISITELVAYSRVRLLYHTVGQVVAGAVVGAVVGAGWYALVAVWARPAFPAIARWRICRALLIRDTSDVGDVLQLEYDATMAAADAAAGAGAGAAAPHSRSSRSKLHPS